MRADSSNHLREIPLSRLLLGVIAAWFATGAMTYYVMTVVPFDERPRRTLHGTVTDVDSPDVGGSSVLDFHLEGYGPRFRVQSGVFRESPLKGTIPETLSPGADATIQVRQTDLEKPFTPLPGRLPTVTIDAMTIAGTELLTLDASRAWDKSNRGVLRYMLPVFAIAAVFLTWLAVRRIQLARAERRSQAA